ncbi:hypothetical protein G7Z17_g8312 [Cylindrodendrum hubeiense]|uniref:Uncharacterized protein n=1 Tax=Cylindrodendrum hubeiense TaxID=595255 RepID=A0A9P5L6M0_9HYPO|nr:hypothetical protein G7Z17_g8312 [Cylindrodendrum hubeiense]
MRGLTKAAAFLLAPALARASSSSLADPWAIVDLDIPKGHHDVDSLTLRLDLQETEEICGPTKLRINGHTLVQNGEGSGSGFVPVGDDIIMSAHWLFSCVSSNNGPEAKLLRFTIDKLDGEPVKDLDFAMTFRQTTPAVIIELGGAASTDPWAELEYSEDRPHKGNHPHGGDHPHEGHHPGEMPDPNDELEAQINELELLRLQADDLMDLIHAKEMAIRERLGDHGDHPPRPPPPPHPSVMLKECGNVQCVVRALANKVKHTAGGLYGGFFAHGPGHEHEHAYDWGNSGERPPHRDGGHHKPPGFPGNHSRPFPPPHRPSFCPPCHGPPPPSHTLPPPTPAPAPSRSPSRTPHDGK